MLGAASGGFSAFAVGKTTGGENSPSIEKLYPKKSNLLVAADFPKPVADIEITGVAVEEDQDGVEGVVLTLKGFEKRLRCNATNARELSKRFGDEADKWVGQKIMLASVPTTFGTEQTKGIRVI